MSKVFKHPNVIETEVRPAWVAGKWVTQLVIYTDLNDQPDVHDLAKGIVEAATGRANEAEPEWSDVLVVGRKRTAKAQDGRRRLGSVASATLKVDRAPAGEQETPKQMEQSPAAPGH